MAKIYTGLTGGDMMAVVYSTLIIKGKKTLEDVPEILREKVKKFLEEMA